MGMRSCFGSETSANTRVFEVSGVVVVIGTDVRGCALPKPRSHQDRLVVVAVKKIREWYRK